MKFKYLLAALAFSVASIAIAEVPSIMVLPGQTWAKAHNYLKAEEHNGRTRYIVMYDEATMDPQFHAAEMAMTEILQNFQLRPESYGGQSDADGFLEGLDAVMDIDGEGAERNAQDDYMSKMKSDIQLLLNWTENKSGFDVSLSLDMSARDTYSGKEIATVTIESPVFSAGTSMPAMLKAAVQNKMPELVAKIQEHFDDLVANGRIINVVFMANSGSGVNCRSDFNGKTLGALIYEWMGQNTVNGKFNERAASPNRLMYNQVRIPLTNESGMALNAGRYIDGTVNYLKSLGLKAENASPSPGLAVVKFND